MPFKENNTFWILVSQMNEVSSHQVFEESLKWTLALLTVQHTIAWQFLWSIRSSLCQVKFVEGEKVSWELIATFQKCLKVQESHEWPNVQDSYEVDITGQSYGVRGCIQDALHLNRRSFGLATMWCFPDKKKVLWMQEGLWKLLYVLLSCDLGAEK